MPPPQRRNPPRGVSPEGPGSEPRARPASDDRDAAPKKRRPPAEPQADKDKDKKSEARKDLD